MKVRIAELEKTIQAQKKAVEGGDLWSSLGDVASAVETRAKERADARDRQSRTRAKAIVSHAQFTALEVIGKASKQYDAMMTAGGAQVDVTNDTLHEGYTEYIKYIAGLNGVVEDTIHNLEDTLDNATKKMAEAMVAIKSLREVRKPLVKAMEDVFKPVELSGIKTADKLPGMDDVLAFIASAPGVGISEDTLTDKGVEETIGKVDDTYTDMQVNIANAQLKAGVLEEPKEEVTEERRPRRLRKSKRLRRPRSLRKSRRPKSLRPKSLRSRSLRKLRRPKNPRSRSLRKLRRPKNPRSRSLRKCSPSSLMMQLL